jgi:hypothetical protein
VRFSRGKSFDPGSVNIEADDIEAHLDRPHGDWKSRVPLADDDQAITLRTTH